MSERKENKGLQNESFFSVGKTKFIKVAQIKPK